MSARTSGVLVTGAVLLSACAEGEAPRFVDLGPQVAVVGQPLLLRLIASDPEGDPLRYGFSSMTLIELQRDAQLSVSPDGQALFSWTPLAADLGEHFVDFSVSDDDHQVHMLVAFDVRGAVGDGSAPVFRKPQGEGVAHDLQLAPCVTPMASRGSGSGAPMASKGPRRGFTSSYYPPTMATIPPRSSAFRCG